MQLTDRQRQIKDRLDRGLGAREIAEDLGITRNAVYQQIQRLRNYGVLEYDFTPTGQPTRETPQPGSALLAKLMPSSTSAHPDELGETAMMAIVNELRRTRDDLDMITRRLSSIFPR